MFFNGARRMFGTNIFLKKLQQAWNYFLKLNNFICKYNDLIDSVFKYLSLNSFFVGTLLNILQWNFEI